MKLVRARLRDIVDLGSAIPALVRGIRKRVDGHFRDRVEAKHEIRREAAIEIRKRVIRLQAVYDVSVREGRQPVEFHVAKPVRTAHEIVAASSRIDKRTRRELQWVGHIPAW